MFTYLLTCLIRISDAGMTMWLQWMRFRPWTRWHRLRRLLAAATTVRLPRYSPRTPQPPPPAFLTTSSEWCPISTLDSLPPATIQELLAYHSYNRQACYQVPHRRRLFAGAKSQHTSNVVGGNRQAALGSSLQLRYTIKTPRKEEKIHNSS